MKRTLFLFSLSNFFLFLPLFIFLSSFFLRDSHFLNTHILFPLKYPFLECFLSSILIPSLLDYSPSCHLHFLTPFFSLALTPFFSPISFPLTFSLSLFSSVSDGTNVHSLCPPVTFIPLLPILCALFSSSVPDLFPFPLRGNKWTFRCVTLPFSLPLIVALSLSLWLSCYKNCITNSQLINYFSFLEIEGKEKLLTNLVSQNTTSFIGCVKGYFMNECEREIKESRKEGKKKRNRKDEKRKK